MTTTAEKYARLLDALHDKASSGKVEWSMEDFTEEVKATVGPFTIGLSYFNREDEPFIRVRVYNHDDEVVDTFTDEDLSGQVPRGSFESYWPLMNDLFRTGKRVATGADAILDQVISTLTEDEDVDDDVPF
jgi:hypothetical protein